MPEREQPCGFDLRLLDLHLEGELRGEDAGHASRHLEGCVWCREYATAYDELTRHLLAGGVPGEAPEACNLEACLASPVDEVMDRIHAGVGAPAGAAIIQPPWMRRLERSWRVAAAVVATTTLALLGLSQLRGPHPELARDDLASPSERTKLLLASSAAAAAGWGNNSRELRRGRLQWVVDGRHGGPAASPSESPRGLRLYGVSTPLQEGPPDGRAVDGSCLEWVVDATWPRWRQHRLGSRFFLVLDVDGRAAQGGVEFIPVSWFGPSAGDRGTLPVDPSERLEPTYYRVLVVSRPELACRSLPVEDVRGVDGLLPLLAGGAEAPPRWVIPAGFR